MLTTKIEIEKLCGKFHLLTCSRATFRHGLFTSSPKLFGAQTFPLQLFVGELFPPRKSLTTSAKIIRRLLKLFQSFQTANCKTTTADFCFAEKKLRVRNNLDRRKSSRPQKLRKHLETFRRFSRRRYRHATFCS